MTDRETGPRVFQEGDPWTQEQARKGGKVSVEMRRRKARGKKPYDESFLTFRDAVGMTGPSQRAWGVFWKAVDAVPMGEEELAIFRRHTDRKRPPRRPVREAWMAMGRRSGKTINAAARKFWEGIRFDPSGLAPGEMAVIPIIAADRRQARQLLGYVRGFAEREDFEPFVLRHLKEAIELKNGVLIEVHTASYRSIRGYTTPAMGCDEIAFWRTDDDSASPDTEVLNAARPSLATIPGSLLTALSSLYAADGALWEVHERYFGVDDDRVLVWNADTRSMNPTVSAEVVERAFEEDPVAAASEWGSEGRVQFRRDVESFLDPEAVKAVTDWGTRELAPREGVEYRAFVDPSGGAQDSMTLAVAHEEGEDLAVLDAVRETRAPFSPESVVEDFAALLRTYGVREVTGDRYGGEWPREAFARRGIEYRPSERTKSDLYREFVAPVNSARVRLLDLPVLRAQLANLERRTARGGRDSIDHGPGGRDDVANAAAGALGLVLKVPDESGRKRIWFT